MVSYPTAVVYAQNQTQEEVNASKFQVFQTGNSERFTIPYTASNNDRKNPLVYKYEEPKENNWLLNIQNNMSYAARQDAKTIIRIEEPEPSEKFLELAMFGDTNNKFWVAFNNDETGYTRLYERENDGWSRDEPIVIGHANNQGLTISNGKRIIIDKLDVDGLNIGSIVIYGKDESTSSFNTYAGSLTFDVFYGSPSDTFVYYVPLGVMVGVGGLITTLLVLKKRKP